MNIFIGGRQEPSEFIDCRNAIQRPELIESPVIALIALISFVAGRPGLAFEVKKQPARPRRVPPPPSHGFTELLEDALAGNPQLHRNKREELIDDRRFAEAIYRAAFASGLMEQVACQDSYAETG